MGIHLYTEIHFQKSNINSKMKKKKKKESHNLLLSEPTNNCNEWLGKNIFINFVASMYWS